MIEERIVNINDKEKIGELEHFLWKNKGKYNNTKNKLLFQRSDEIPYYNEVVILENKYLELQKELLKSYKLRTVPFVFLTLMFIIPGIIYKNIVNNHNYKIEEPNNLIYEKMEEVLDKASRYNIENTQD